MPAGSPISHRPKSCKYKQTCAFLVLLLHPTFVSSPREERNAGETTTWYINSGSYTPRGSETRTNITETTIIQTKNTTATAAAATGTTKATTQQQPQHQKQKQATTTTTTAATTNTHKCTSTHNNLSTKRNRSNRKHNCSSNNRHHRRNNNSSNSNKHNHNTINIVNNKFPLEKRSHLDMQPHDYCTCHDTIH